ncbi:hypothetical protein CXG81DRAFT_21383 [Caulochytrium protostelioides]|uniref:Hydrophobin n=1 Tax=Caulochytrium protostelioides TaxID=1555241 RepID=A0A4P9X252_9FUNG|nr:hypothetical protein CXG81DRAFT_21383 [Caulochytrium protostelioides]|eukprot:RKO98370.1 hypothetical protein CXG81DRAFT_21383 [Caulochytrium protostelioides]
MFAIKTLIAAGVVLGATTGALAGPVAGDTALACGNGSTSYCCSQISSPDSSATGILSGILNNLHVGVNCSPVTVQLLSSTSVSQCSSSLVCCSGSSMSGKTQLGCDARTQRKMGPDA